MLLTLLLVGLLSTSCTAGAAGYRDVEQVASVLNENGVGCADLQMNEPTSLVTMTGRCATDGGRLGIYLFVTEEARDRWLLVGEDLGNIVVGPNWVVDPPTDDLSHRVAEATGGDIR